jgi:DNA repair protein RadD
MELRDYQRETVNAVFRWFKEHKTGACIGVLPTGSGKTPVLADIAKQICLKGPDRRVLIVAHRKELLSQSVEKLLRVWPDAVIGIWSAGLGEKTAHKQITVAGIQSVYSKASLLGAQSLVIVDEAHRIRVDDEGMYNRLFRELVEVNPNVRIFGLTATPYRLGTGMLVGSGGVFTDIAHNVSVTELLAKGHLSPVRVKMPKNAQASLAKVRVRAGEFVDKDLEKAFNVSSLIEREVIELEKWGEERKSWLVFCTTVVHAKAVSAVLNARGHQAEVVEADTPGLFRDRVLSEFKSGRLKCIVNVGVLTEGFDAPNVDLIGVMRATQSTGLWIQICGRGSRVAPGKKDCIVLDFGKNAIRLGTLESNVISSYMNPVSGEKSFEVQATPIRICPQCEEVVPSRELKCLACNHEFPVPKQNVSNVDAYYKFEVLSVNYDSHVKPDKPSSFRCDYTIADSSGKIEVIKEWVCFEHTGFARLKALSWWGARTRFPNDPNPRTVNEALSRAGELRKPSKLKAMRKDGFWRISHLEFAADEVDQSDKFFEETGVNI